MITPEILTYVVFANAAITLGTAVYSFMTSPASKAMAAVEKLAKTIETERSDQKLANEAVVARLQLVESRVQRVEATIEHLPDRDSAHRLELAVEKLNGRIETLDERLKPVAAIADRMQEILLEQAKR